MTNTPAAEPNPIETAAQQLVDALVDVAAIRGFRDGLQHIIAWTETQADPNNPAHFEALDALTVWRALAQLVDAVQAYREEHRHG